MPESITSVCPRRPCVLVHRGFVQSASLERAYVISGMSLCFAGSYLGLWVLIFSAPEHVLDGLVWSYAERDLVQQQHLAISCLAVTGGVLEILWAVCGSPQRGGLSFRHDGWHVLWAMNEAMIGVLFLIHPQHSGPRGVVIHTSLGMCMAYAAMFLMVLVSSDAAPNMMKESTPKNTFYKAGV